MFLSLQEENRLLYEREQKLKERERMLSISQSNLQTITDHQARQQVAAVQQVRCILVKKSLWKVTSAEK